MRTRFLASLSILLISAGIVNAAPKVDASTEIFKTMEALEKKIEKSPNEPNLPVTFLELGKLKKQSEGVIADALQRAWLNQRASSHTVEWAYAKSRPAEYQFNVQTSSFCYTGFHFQEILDRFPEHPMAEEAAWEMTRLTPAWECAGYVNCFVNRDLVPLTQFLSRFPASRHAREAVSRANSILEKATAGVDLRTSTTDFKKDDFVTKLSRYEKAIAKVAKPERDSAARVISALRKRLGN
jgi:hypothetical protein